MVDDVYTQDRLAFEQMMMNNPSMLDTIKRMDPAQRAAFMDVAFEDYANTRAELGGDISAGEALISRGMDMPEGRMAGRIYVAPNPLEVAGQVAQAFGGMALRNRGKEGLQKLSEDATAARRGMADALLADTPKKAPETAPAAATVNVDTGVNPAPPRMPNPPRGQDPIIQQAMAESEGYIPRDPNYSPARQATLERLANAPAPQAARGAMGAPTGGAGSPMGGWGTMWDNIYNRVIG